MERPNCHYLADCSDMSAELRCLCMEDDLALLMKDFKEWVDENHFTVEDIYYAHVIDNSGERLEHIGNFVLKDDGSVELVTVSRKKRLRRKR